MRTAGGSGRFSLFGISYYGFIDGNAVKGTLPPVELAVLNLLLLILCATSLGMFMITLNLLFQKNVGTLLVLAVVMLTPLVRTYVPDSLLDKGFDFIYPIRIAMPKDKIVVTGLKESLIYGVVYFCFMMVLIWIAGNRIIRNKGGQM